MRKAFLLAISAALSGCVSIGTLATNTLGINGDVNTRVGGADNSSNVKTPSSDARISPSKDPTQTVSGPGATPRSSDTPGAQQSSGDAANFGAPSPTPSPSAASPNGHWVAQGTSYNAPLVGVSMASAQQGEVIEGGYGSLAVLSTSNGGGVWQSLSGSASANAKVIAGWFNDPENGWVGTQSTGGIFRTTDGGKTWTLSQAGFSIDDIKFANATTGVAAGAYTWMTTDGGATWSKTSVNNMNAVCTLGDDIWTSGGGGVYAYRPGVGWAQLRSEGSDYGLNNAYDSGISFVSPTEGWVVNNRNTEEGGSNPIEVVHTTDGGSTWQTVALKTAGGSVLTPATSYGCDVSFVDAQHGWITCYDHIISTSDGGNTWVDTKVPGVTNILRIQMVDLEHGWAVTENGVILRYAVF